MTESIPCPFCGSEDYYITVTDNPFSYDTYSTAHCSKCHATGSFVAESYLEDEPKPTRDYMETMAKEKWQTRPIEDALKARIAELEAEIDQLTAHDATERQDDKWIPVSERLPEDGKPVWVCTIWNEQHSGFLIDGVWGGLFRDFREGEITHWMPLPVLPESPNDTQTQAIVYGKESMVVERRMNDE